MLIVSVTPDLMCSVAFSSSLPALLTLGSQDQAGSFPSYASSPVIRNYTIIDTPVIRYTCAPTVMVTAWNLLTILLMMHKQE